MAVDQTPEPKPPATRRSGAVAGAVIGALVAVFAVLNSQSVSVDWIGTTTKTPLIVVILLFLMIGFVAGVLYSRRAGGRKRRP
jgi:uncharacterized integral membrane protein